MYMYRVMEFSEEEKYTGLNVGQSRKGRKSLLSAQWAFVTKLLLLHLGFRQDLELILWTKIFFRYN